MKPGNRLRAMRKAAGFTQTQLADATGVSQPTISALENGTQEMSFSWARTFARVLGCRFVDLLDDEDADGVVRDELESHLITRARAADPTQKQMLERVTAAVVPLASNDDPHAKVA